MADISKLKLPNGSEYDLKVYTDHIAPMMSKTFTGVVGTANTDVDCTFFFGTIKPVSYYDIWKIKYRVYAHITGTASTYNQYAQARSEVTLFGSENTYQAYHILNQIHHTSYRPAYYNTIYNLKKAGVDAGLGHALGIGLRYSWNAYSSSYPREITIQILQCENCQFTFLDNMVKWTALSNFNTTNYETYRQLDFAVNGLQQTSDNNDVNYQNKIYYSGTSLKAYAAGGRYTLTFTKNSNYVLPITSTDNSTSGGAKTYTTESFDPFGEIYYRNASGAIAAEDQIANATLYRQIIVDARYSFTGVLNGSSSVMVANKPVYIVCTPQLDGFVKLAENPLSFELPNSEDGLYYILLGYAYNTYQFELLLNHPVYQYKNGKIFQLNKNNEGSLIKNIPVNNKNILSGTVVTFSDGMDTPVEDLTVDLEPIQDLHGQANPYPAGGGKNICDIDGYLANTETVYTKNGDEYTITANIALYNNPLVFSDTDIEITLSCASFVNGTTTNGRIDLLNSNGSIVGGIYASSVSKFTTVTASKMRFNWTNAGTFSISKLQIEKGSSASAYSPYSNICPISGRQSVTVTRSGVNVWDEECESGYIEASSGREVADPNKIRMKNYVSVRPNTSYFKKSPVSFWNVYFDRDKNYISYGSAGGNTVFTTPENCYYIRCGFESAYGTTYNHDISINYPSTDRDYHPGTVASVEVQLGQTVYGGTVDVTTGEMVVDRYWFKGGWTQYASGNGYKAYRSAEVPQGLGTNDIDSKPMSNMISSFGSFSSSAMSKNIIQPPRNNTNIAYMALQEDLDSTDVELSYIMLNPVTITLTPEQLTTLIGTNNIWSDADNITVGYINNVGVFIPDASEEKPGLMSAADKIKLNNINNNHIIISTTQPTNQQSGDYWFVMEEYITLDYQQMPNDYGGNTAYISSSIQEG